MGNEGKWTIHEDGLCVLIRENGKLVAQLVMREPGRAGALELLSRAKFIAAAPDLYAALEGAQEELRLIRMKDTGAVYDPTIRARISLALSLARGERG